MRQQCLVAQLCAIPEVSNVTHSHLTVQVFENAGFDRSTQLWDLGLKFQIS